MDKVVPSAGAYVGTFVKSDPKNFNGIWRDYLRVRAIIDIEKPLKRRMKLCHSERFCIKRFDQDIDQIVKPYGIGMKALMRKKNYLIGAQWLRTGNDDTLSGVMGMLDLNVRENQEYNGMDMAAGKFMGNVDISNNRDKVNIQDQELTLILENKKRRMDGGVKGGSDDVVTDVENDAVMEKEIDDSVGPKNLLKDLMVQKKPNFVFLCETLSRKDVVERLRVSLGFEGAIAVDVQGKSGGVAMLWRFTEEVQVLGYGVNYIDVSVNSSDNGRWRLTGLYGEPNRSFRQRTWDLIRNLKEEQGLPWCIIGDLNNVTSQQDKRGGNAYPNWLINGFCGMLDDCGLHDLDLEGYSYTWERGRGTDEWIEVRIDRAIVTQQFLDMFPTVKLINLEVSTSDHCPLLLVPVKSFQVRKFLAKRTSLQKDC
uniref:Endonuclease/exonuclease/phosphatase domain-containing protein n=1 Tax=Cannabis sativa TaxID=3483 RepID=A0A803NTY0_CANSA